MKNVKRLESAGMPHAQAEVLAEIIEEAQFATQEGLKEFIRNEFGIFEKKIGEKFNTLRIQNDEKFNALQIQNKDLEIRLLNHQRDMLIKIVGIFASLLALAVAVIKLF